MQVRLFSSAGRPCSAELFGLEVEKLREEEEPRTMLTHNPLVLMPPANSGMREEETICMSAVTR